MTDKTNYVQSLMHLIKCNLGTGMLAMPASFAHCGLIASIIGLPALCLIAIYAVHLLVRSSQHLENKLKWIDLDFAQLAKGAFKSGPDWIKPFSGLMCRTVDFMLIMNQIGICCVYLLFVNDNLAKIFSSFNIDIPQSYIFMGMLPLILALSYIRTLRRLSIASSCANVLQAFGICAILEFLWRELPSKPEIHMVKPISEIALGFGSTMFAFEGIAVIIPLYSRMKRPEQVGGTFGIINIAYVILLCLYFMVGLLGYLRYGDRARGSITLNLPREPFYEVIRGIFTTSILLSYPLQFYVVNEIIWNWIKTKCVSTENKSSSNDRKHLKYEYLFRTFLVLLTFLLAMTVPKLNLVMDLFGSISGASLSIILPVMIHLVAFWEDTSGAPKIFMILVDVILILIGIIASVNGSYFSFMGILESFTGTGEHAHHVTT